MTEAVQIALITGVCAAIPATAAAIFGMRSVKKGQKDEMKVIVNKLATQDIVAEQNAGAVVIAAKDAAAAADKAVVVTGEIHDLVNSRLTIAEERIAVANKANAELMTIVSNQAKMLSAKINGPTTPPPGR